MTGIDLQAIHRYFHRIGDIICSDNLDIQLDRIGDHGNSTIQMRTHRRVRSAGNAGYERQSGQEPDPAQAMKERERREHVIYQSRKLRPMGFWSVGL